ncbi:MAG: hypothetical protein ABI555_01975 [Chloroflexota bacterium]
MDEGVTRVLNLVAEGRLTADEAGPILDALASAGATAPAGRLGQPGGASGSNPLPDSGAADSGSPRFARIQVREGGRRVVDLRVPVSLGRFALGRVPGLSAQHIADVEEAVASGSRGPILDIEDSDGDGVRIVLE